MGRLRSDKKGTRNTPSITAGIILAKIGALSSRHGLLLTQIRKVQPEALSIQSSPNNSKVKVLRFLSSQLKVALIASVASFIILGTTSFARFIPAFVASRYFWKSWNESLLPHQYFPYYQHFFWTASFVRWIILLDKFFRVNYLEAVRMQPY